jgi:integrase
LVYHKTIQLSPITQQYVNGLNEGTRRNFASRLWKLELFFQDKYGSQPIECIFDQLKKGKINFIHLIVDFKNHPLNQKLNTAVIRGVINTAVNFIEEVTDLEISRNKLKKRLHLGKPNERDEHPLDRPTVFKLLSTCTNPRLKAYLHLISAIGCRPKQEALLLRVKNVIFESERPHIHFPASITKTNKERNPFMTQELIDALKIWLDYKYRERNRVSINNGDGNNRTITEKITPAKNGEDLLFAGYEYAKINSMYVTITNDFHKLLKDL